MVIFRNIPKDLLQKEVTNVVSLNPIKETVVIFPHQFTNAL
jgi:hypothetical protein